MLSSNQTAYLNDRFIIGGVCLISDMFEVSDFVTVDIEKAFDSANHNFLLKLLENFVFSEDFLE